MAHRTHEWIDREIDRSKREHASNGQGQRDWKTQPSAQRERQSFSLSSSDAENDNEDGSHKQEKDVEYDAEDVEKGCHGRERD